MNSLTPEQQRSLQSRKVLEHLRHSRIYIVEPKYQVHFFVDGELEQAFGFDYVTRREAEDAITFRAAILMDCCFMDAHILHRCTAQIIGPGLNCWFAYNAEQLTYQETDAQEEADEESETEIPGGEDPPGSFGTGE